jgi:hypothetical protein
MIPFRSERYDGLATTAPPTPPWQNQQNHALGGKGIDFMLPMIAQQAKKE